MKHKVPIKTLRSRPRFKVYTLKTKEKFISKIQKHLARHEGKLDGYANGEVAMIRVVTDQDQYWKPEVQIRIEQDENNGNFLAVRGVIGPRPNVWTLFMFMYGFAGALFVTMGTFVLSEYIVKGESNWLWSLFLAAGIALTAFLASKIGQYISRDQLKTLYSFIDEILADSKFYERNK